MPTLEETFAEMEAKAQQKIVNDVLEIDVETREIIIPDTEALFGVENDKKSERKYFKIPRYVGNNLDLMKANLYVNYENAGGSKDVYVVTDKALKDENIEFTWELGSNVTEFRGIINFIVCAKWSATNGIIENEWNTTLASGTSLQGLEAEEQVKHEARDILEQLLNLYNLSVKKELQYSSETRQVKLKG